MPITTIGGKRAFETGSVILPVGVTEFELTSQALALTVQLRGADATPALAGTQRPVLTLPALPAGDEGVMTGTIANGDVSYRYTLGIRSIADAAGSVAYLIDYSITA